MTRHTQEKVPAAVRRSPAQTVTCRDAGRPRDEFWELLVMAWVRAASFWWPHALISAMPLRT
ncbi:hypothetical protein ACHGLA_28210 [Streptomyces sp. YH02]|uniref:hypothetical protein n=1 Tax=Streptomyces sp. YH02 TaxID=3256999 RepID=UPI003756587E